MLIDDAHGFGAMGATGAGAAEAQGVQNDIDIYFSTFAKSMGSIGGFIASNENVINYLRYNTRSQIYAKTLPMVFVVGNMKRLELLRTRPDLRENLWKVLQALGERHSDEQLAMLFFFKRFQAIVCPLEYGRTL